MRPIFLFYGCLTLGLLGFGMVSLFGSYWFEHRVMGGSLLITLAVLSLYVSRLIAKLAEAVEWAEVTALVKQRFRAAKCDMHSPLKALSAVSDVKESSLQLSGTRALLVGFDAAEQDATEKSLVSWGASASVVNNTCEALAAVAETSRAGKPFHAVLVYENSAIKDILSIPSRFYEHASTQQLPLICCLPNYDLPVKRKLLAAGFRAVLPLPVDKRLLFNALHPATIKHEHQNGVVSLADYYAKKEMAKRTLRILVAEDNPTNQKVIARMLERAGHQVKIVEDGEFAVNELEHASYDILILDMHMPNMGGLDAIKALRFVQSKHEEIPIIVLSTEATSSEIKECEELGIGAFLPKPVQTNRLLDTIAQLAHKRAPDRSGELSSQVSADTSDRQIINLSMLSELETFSTDPAFIPTLIHGFVRDSRTLLQQMERALELSDSTDFKDLLHAMKGSAVSIGAEQLSDLCSRLAYMEQKKLVADTAKILNQIAETLASTCLALSEYLKARQSAVS